MAANIGWFTLPRPSASMTRPFAPWSTAACTSEPSAPPYDLEGRHRVDFDWHVLSPSWRAVEDDPIKVHLAEKAVITRFEGFHAGSVGLGHLPRRVDLVVHYQHRAHAGRGLIHGDSHRIEQVARPVEVRLGGDALGADEYNRLGGSNSQVEPPRRLLQRVRTMRNDNSSHFGAGERGFDGTG
jgi:hypothetical protein